MTTPKFAGGNFFCTSSDCDSSTCFKPQFTAFYGMQYLLPITPSRNVTNGTTSDEVLFSVSLCSMVFLVVAGRTVTAREINRAWGTCDTARPQVTVPTLVATCLPPSPEFLGLPLWIVIITFALGCIVLVTIAAIAHAQIVARFVLCTDDLFVAAATPRRCYICIITSLFRCWGLLQTTAPVA